MNKAKLGAQQWRNAQESLISLESKNVASVDSIVRFATLPSSQNLNQIFIEEITHFLFHKLLIRGGIEANETLRSRFSSAVSVALEDADIANKNMLSSIDR